ncbi:hypothetical protein [Mesobacillus harenae]|nr:hypothetical protein [Mesobacillus harenae]
MDKIKKEEVSKQTSVEFGNEFGDMNASKLYEIPYANQQKADNKKNKNKR